MFTLSNPQADVERESKVKTDVLICWEGGGEFKPLIKALARAEAMSESNLGAPIEESLLQKENADILYQEELDTKENLDEQSPKEQTVDGRQ